MFFKYTMSPESAFMSVGLGKAERGRQKSVNKIVLPLLYPDGRSIQRPKLKALVALIKDKHVTAFYKHLRCATEENDNEGASIWSESESETESDGDGADVCVE